MEANKMITLTLPVEMVNVVLAGLAKLPLEQSIVTFDEIQKQAKEQVQAQTESK